MEDHIFHGQAIIISLNYIKQRQLHGSNITAREVGKLTLLCAQEEKRETVEPLVNLYHKGILV